MQQFLNSSAFGRGRADRPDHDQQHCYHHAPTVKPEAATAIVELLMMGMMMPETCWAVHKRQVTNLRSCCILLVDSVEKMLPLVSISIKTIIKELVKCVSLSY